MHPGGVVHKPEIWRRLLGHIVRRLPIKHESLLLAVNGEDFGVHVSAFCEGVFEKEIGELSGNTLEGDPNPV